MEEYMKSINIPATTLRDVGSISLLALPIMLATAFALHYTALSDFFAFTFTKPPYSAETLRQTLLSEDGGFRRFTLPHLVGYLALPLFISSSLTIAASISKRVPWHAFFGVAFTCFGVVFMGGVFGAWLSFAAVGNIQEQAAVNLLAVLQALTTMQGALMLSSALSAFTFLGMIILGVGLYQSRITPRWSAALFVLGNALILLFIDLDNWMFTGATLMVIGILPLSIKLFHQEGAPWAQGAAIA
jgi:hypothetical protein